MFASLRPRRLAGAIVALVGVLSLAACALPGVNATPDAATILAKVQAVKVNDAVFTFTYSGSLSADAQTSQIGSILTSFGASPDGTLSGNGSGAITANPQRAKLSFILPFQILGTTPSLDLLYDGSGPTLYASSNILVIAGAATGIKTWYQVPLGQLSGFDASPFLNYSQLLNVSVVGSETVNGVSTYHLKGTESASSSVTIDLWVNQENYSPVQATFNLNTLIVGKITVLFGNINTGQTITPPTADEIINS